LHDLAKLLHERVAAGIKRTTITTPSRWARTYRTMGAPFPGPWTPEPAPWTLEMHDSKAPINIGQKSAQMGYSETLLNVTLFKIDVERIDCLYILPAKTPDATEFSAARFDVALELSPHLKGLFSSVKNVGHKRAGSANLYIRGSNSRSSLKSIPVAFIAYDEFDEMNMRNLSLAEERTSGQKESQSWKVSTPTIPEYGINLEFNTSTQERYFFKCPYCGKYVDLTWPESIVIVGEYATDPRIVESHIICKECKHKLEHEDKREFLRAKNDGGTGIWIPKNEDIIKRGFYINQLYSIARPAFDVIAKYFSGLTDKASEQEFFNSKLGLPHIVDGAKLDDEQINSCITTEKPSDFNIITMGVDQGKWLHYEVVGWKFTKLSNDLNISAEAFILDAGKKVDFTELDVLMRQWQIMSVVIDAQPERRLAYEFACRFWGHVFLCFYARGQKSRDITVNRDLDQHTITVDRTSWLDLALNRFRTRTIHLSPPSEEYREHIKNITKHYKKVDEDVVSEYLSRGPDHYAHARCYNEIALPLAASLTTNQNVRVFL